MRLTKSTSTPFVANIDHAHIFAGCTTHRAAAGMAEGWDVKSTSTQCLLIDSKLENTAPTDTSRLIFTFLTHHRDIRCFQFGKGTACWILRNIDHLFFG